MTKITFYKNNDYIVKMQIEGHTGYADSGKDILCSAISAISQSVVLGLQKVAKCPIGFKRDLKKGFLSVWIQAKDEDSLKNAQMLLQTAKISFEDLQIGYEKFMKVEVCDEIY